MEVDDLRKILMGMGITGLIFVLFIAKGEDIRSVIERIDRRKPAMPHKKRKVRKQRGLRTYGYGRVGQHRDGGQRGGHGKAGLHKHKWSYVLRCELDYSEKRGFKSPRGNEANTINVGELPEQVDQLLEEKKAVKRRDGIYIDLAELAMTSSWVAVEPAAHCS